MNQQTSFPNNGRRLGRARVLFPSAWRAVRAPMLLAVALATVMVLGAGCDSTVAPADEAAAAPVNARGSWNNWHVHDGGTGQVDATGLRHEGYEIWPVIFEDYAETPSLHAYCPDGIEGHSGSKLGSGICRNDEYIIPIRANASDAPAPAGWTALPLGGGVTLYYRLISR